MAKELWKQFIPKRAAIMQAGEPMEFPNYSGAPKFNNVNRPYSEIFVQDNVVETVISLAGKANKVQIAVFNTNGISNICVADHTNDHIIIKRTGNYKVIIPISVSSGSGDGDVVGFSLYKNNGTVEFPNVHQHRKLAGGIGDLGSMTLSGTVFLEDGDTLEVWGWNEGDADNFTIDDITLNIFQVG